MKSFGDASVLSLGAAATAVATAAKAIWDLASGCAATAAEIAKMSQMAGMTTSTYQEWAYVFQQLGIENDKLVDGVNTLAEQMFETSEEGSAALATLGISLEGMNKEEAFAAVITALQGIEDDTLKCQLANALFGESYAELMPLLNSTTEDVNSLIQEANDLGIVMSQDCVEAGTKFTQSQSKLQSQFQAIGNQIGSVFVPILTVLMDVFSKIINVVSTVLKPVLDVLGTAFTFLGGVIEGVIDGAFTHFGNIIENIKTSLGGVIDFITGVFTGNWSKAWEGVKSIFSGIVGGIANIFKAPINAIITGINSFLRGLNKIKIPDWVPGVGGKGFNIATIPMLASGGNIVKSGAAIVGEAGAELIELPKGARVSPLSKNDKPIGGNITQNNYFTQRELTPYETQLQVKRLSRNLAGAF